MYTDTELAQMGDMGSVVLKPVPPNTTVAGVPARVIGRAGCAEPAITMDQSLAEEE